MAGFLAGHEGSDDAGVHVIAAFVGGYLVCAANRGGEHSGGGGFTVGAGDERDRPAESQVFHDLGVDFFRNQSADHAAGATSGGTRSESSKPRQPNGRPGARA